MNWLDLLIPSISLIGGLIVLGFGAEWTVSSAVKIAQFFNVSALMIGLTVVSFGTSAPELAVSLMSAFQDSAGIAVGNVLGSNIFNILVILGLSSLISPLIVHLKIIRREVPLMILFTVIVYFLAFNSNLDRLDGLICVGCLVGYLSLQGYLARKQGSKPESLDEVEELLDKNLHRSWKTLTKILGLLLVGLAALVAGSEFFVRGATTIAHAFGVSDLIVGLTIVALGTSLPEIATSLVAALRGQNDIAVANVVGSNIFNLLAVLGITSLVSPLPLGFEADSLRFDFPFVIYISVLCLPIFMSGARINRAEGCFFFGSYLIYTIYLFYRVRGVDWLNKFEEMAVIFGAAALLVFVLVPALSSTQQRRH